MNQTPRSPDAEVGCGHGEQSISVAEALAHIRTELSPLSGSERVPLDQALDRLLDRAVDAPIDVPGHDNSAMDGYAVRFQDLQPGQRLRIIGEAFAGHVFEGSVGPGECVRIMTGGVVPAGADTVVMQEKAHRDGAEVWFNGTHQPASNIRRRGEDIRAGELVLPAGRRLGPADLGLLASLGVAEVNVRRRLKVAIMSTGDELRLAGEKLGPGQIYDSNRYTLRGMLTRFGAEVLDLGVVADQPDRLSQALDQAAEKADVIITSGGVSVGEADYVTALLAERGSVGFWKINIRPGRPLAFGRFGKAAFFGLPGNPVSVMVTFCQIVLPALEHLQGLAEAQRLRLRAMLTEPIRKKDPRREFQRGVMSMVDDGSIQVRTTGSQSSGVLRSMSDANCFIVLPEGPAALKVGDWVTVEPLIGFG